MQTRQRLMLDVVHREAGFTLVEVLVAVGLLTIGILGVGLALSASGGIASGGSVGLAAVSRSNSYSTATQLAQARLEEIKNAIYSKTGPTDEITTANFPDDAYGAIAGYSGFRRTVSIQDATPAAAMKTITVQVFFTPQYGTRIGSEENVQVATIIAQRP
jgi:prepilin-type N-terminal cleavage/methylation domain-containing protein